MTKVLIVDDQLINRQLLINMLQKHVDLCHEVENGREAVNAFMLSLDQQEPYDLILLDIMMPVLDGREALQEIRQVEKERGIGGHDMVKVLMTTAVNEAKTIVGAFIGGSCEGYLTKPIEMKKLFEFLKQFGLYKTKDPKS